MIDRGEERSIGSKRWTRTPPDGGWGWMVAIGAFLCTMMISIPAITFGVLLDDLIVAMNTKTATATWTMSILLGVSGVISPIVTIAIDLLSCRKAAIFGGLFMSIGLMLSSFATNIETLFITFGIFGAIGFGCNRVVAIVILGQYFKKRYGIGAGLMMAGFSTSRLLFSSVVLWAKVTYGFRGAYLIMGAVCLNICVGASLYQPAKWHSVRKPYDVEYDTPEENAVCKVKTTTTVYDENVKATFELQQQQQKQQSNESKDKSVAVKELDATELQPMQQLPQPPPLTLYAADVSGSLPPEPETAATPSKYSVTTLTRGHVSSIIKTLKATLKFSLFRDPCFHVSLISQVLFQTVILYSMVFLVPLSMDKGFRPLDAVLVQTAKSSAEICGRIGVPWILKVTNSNNIWTHIVINVANGFALLAHALVEDYNAFLSTAICTGFLSGGIVVQAYHLILLTLGKDKFAAAIGLCAFTQGIFMFFGGPLLGFIRDQTGSLVNSYLLLAALQFGSGLVWTSRAMTIRRNKSRQQDVRRNIVTT